MKKLTILSILVFGSFGLLANVSVDANSGFKAIQSYDQSADMEKTEISPNQLPKEIHKEIVDSYHHAKIQKAWTINHRMAEEKGYLVEVKQGPKVWTIEFDHEGNPVNKVNPTN